MVAPQPEFTRPVEAPRSVGKPAHHTIAATRDECARLALRFDLVTLDRLEAELDLERLAGGVVRLKALLHAELVQTCVATLEPFAASIEDSFTLLYGGADGAREIVLDGEAETIEPLAGNRIDIGEAVAQQLSLALDPFPRSPEAPPP
jgi:uncharacterized metal-binding protein YceD (DUF177 family)